MIKKVLRYFKYIYFSYSFEKDTIIILSIRKSGTNYLRALITNYLYIFYNDKKTRTMHLDIDKNIFPNRREGVYFNLQSYKKCKKDNPIWKAGYKDMMMSHWSDNIEFSKSRKIICVFRNPLDNLVSQYFFFSKNNTVKYQFPNIMECVRARIHHYFIILYKKFLKIQKTRGDVHLISYENLLRYPEVQLNQVLLYLGIPVNQDKIKLAVQFSSKEEVRKEEKSIKKAIHAEKLLKGSFIRSNSIFEWKKHFTKKDVSEIANILNEHNIHLSEFYYK